MRDGRPDGKLAKVGTRGDAAFSLCRPAGWDSGNSTATNWRRHAGCMAFLGGAVGVQGVDAAWSSEAEVEHSSLGVIGLDVEMLKAAIPEQWGAAEAAVSRGSSGGAGSAGPAACCP